MARLIDAEKAANELWGDLGIRVDEILDDVPTVDAADVVEVVRCRNCAHWKKDVPGCTDFVGRCEFGDYMVGTMGYCVYGERKERE